MSPANATHAPMTAQPPPTTTVIDAGSVLPRNSTGSETWRARAWRRSGRTATTKMTESRVADASSTTYAIA